VDLERIGYFSFLKRQTRIGIFGSFIPCHKQDLLAMRDYLKDILGYRACISTDMRQKHNGLFTNDDREALALSEDLIEWSQVHILVFPYPLRTDPFHLDQSASMEYAMIRERKKPCVLVLCEQGLRENRPDSFGGVMKGSLKERCLDFSPEIIDYDSLPGVYEEIAMFCNRSLETIYPEAYLK
jgi:hypothetical protein